MSPARPGGHGTSACHCLPAGRLRFLRPEPALAFFLMTLGRQLDCGSRNNSHLQIGRAGAPRHSPGLLHLGRTLRSDSCPVVFKPGPSKPWDPTEVPQGPLRVGREQRGGSKGYTKQAMFSSTPPTLEQPHFYLVYILDLLINFNFRRKDFMTMKVRKPLILDGM